MPLYSFRVPLSSCLCCRVISQSASIILQSNQQSSGSMPFTRLEGHSRSALSLSFEMRGKPYPIRYCSCSCYMHSTTCVYAHELMLVVSGAQLYGLWAGILSCEFGRLLVLTSEGVQCWWRSSSFIEIQNWQPNTQASFDMVYTRSVSGTLESQSTSLATSWAAAPFCCHPGDKQRPPQDLGATSEWTACSLWWLEAPRVPTWPTPDKLSDESITPLSNIIESGQLHTHRICAIGLPSTSCLSTLVISSSAFLSNSDSFGPGPKVVLPYATMPYTLAIRHTASKAPV